MAFGTFLQAGVPSVPLNLTAFDGASQVVLQLRLASFLLELHLHSVVSVSAVLLSIVSRFVLRQRILFGFSTVSR
jgi:hypothetical protein